MEGYGFVLSTACSEEVGRRGSLHFVTQGERRRDMRKAVFSSALEGTNNLGIRFKVIITRNAAGDIVDIEIEPLHRST